jgi:PST family polysaccharide transporter
VGSTLFGEATGDLMVLAAPAWAFAAAGGVSQALLQRRLDFRTMAVRDALAAVTGTTVAVALALSGVDAPALVIGALTVVAVTSVVSIVVAPQPVRTLRSRRSVPEVTGFAGAVSLSSIVYTLYSNVDYVILGARLSATQVGYYFRAFQLGVEYQGKISGIMLRVSFPVFSRAADMTQLRRARAAIVRAHASVLLPILAAFIALAPDVIPFLYGSAWEGAVLPAQILAVAGMAYAVTTGTGPLMIALGRADALLRWNVVELVAYAVMVWVMSGFGLIPVAIGVAVFASASVLVIQVVLLRPIVGLTILQLWHDVRAGLGAALLVVATCLPLQHALDPEVPIVVRILIVGGCAVGLTIALYVRLFPTALSDLLEVVPIRRFRAGSAVDSVAPKGPT